MKNEAMKLALEPEDKIRADFEFWHKSMYTQQLERYAHTYKNAHVRNRWQGWLSASKKKQGVPIGWHIPSAHNPKE